MQQKKHLQRRTSMSVKTLNDIQEDELDNF